MSLSLEIFFLWRVRFALFFAFWLSLACQGMARDSAEKEIGAIYKSRYVAADMLYLYGMGNGRSDKFVIIDVSGDLIDMEQFLKDWQELMSRALRIRWTGKILRCAPRGHSAVECEVEERLDVVLHDPGFSSRVWATTTVRSKDIWMLQSGAWQQMSSRVVRRSESLLPYSNEATEKAFSR